MTNMQNNSQKSSTQNQFISSEGNLAFPASFTNRQLQDHLNFQSPTNGGGGFIEIYEG